MSTEENNQKTAAEKLKAWREEIALKDQQTQEQNSPTNKKATVDSSAEPQRSFLAGVAESIGTFFTKMWNSIKRFSSRILVSIKGVFSRKTSEDTENLSSSSPNTSKKSTDEVTESFSLAGLWGKITAFVGSNKKKVILGASALVLVVLSLSLIIRFDVVTAAQGIDTTLGSSVNRTVIIDTAVTAQPEDLVVALLPGGQGLLIMGSVFSVNDQSYALYDGEVIWQIPLADIKGVVMFANATQIP